MNACNKHFKNHNYYTNYRFYRKKITIFAPKINTHCKKYIVKRLCAVSNKGNKLLIFLFLAFIIIFLSAYYNL